MTAINNMPVERLEKWKSLGVKRFDIQKARMCLVDWGKLVTNPSFRVRSIDQVFKNNTPSIATLNRYGDERITALILQRLIEYTQKFFKVAGRMDEHDTIETAFLIIDEYPNLTIADLKLCFQRGKTGKYGKLYDRFDGAIILEWLSNYANERIREAENISNRQHHNAKTSINESWTEEGKKKMKELLSIFADNEIKESELYTLSENIESVREGQINGLQPIVDDMEINKNNQEPIKE